MSILFCLILPELSIKKLLITFRIFMISSFITLIQIVLSFRYVNQLKDHLILKNNW